MPCREVLTHTPAVPDRFARAGAGPEGGRGSGVASVSPAPVSAAPSAVFPASYRQEARAKIRTGSEPLLAYDPFTSKAHYEQKTAVTGDFLSLADSTVTEDLD